MCEPIYPAPPQTNIFHILLVKLNNESVINLEMQVNNYLNWVPRSLYYLCREFTSLDHGEDYSKVKPAIHIGFLDFTLFDEHPEFYATYRMCNLKDGYIYTDKFTLSVVELKHTNLASDEDKAYGIDVWAKLFKATTWEDIKMLVQENTYLNSAAHTMFEGNIDDRILALCRKSDQEIQWDINKSKRLDELEKQVKNQYAQITEKDSIIAAQTTELEALRAKLAALEN